jgi:hypothetical protein
MQAILDAIARVARMLGEMVRPAPAPVYVPVRVRPGVRRRR